MVDADLSDTNNYKVKLVGDTRNLVIIESVNKFSVREEICSRALLDDVNFTATCTVLTPGKLETHGSKREVRWPVVVKKNCL